MKLWCLLGVVAVEVRHARAVGTHRPERLVPHGVAVHVVPARVGDAAVGEHGRLPLVRLAEGELPDVAPARVRAVEEEARRVASPVAAAEVLSARGGEHEPAVGQVARVDVLDHHHGLPPFHRLHRVVRRARELAHPAAVRRALVDEVSAVHHGVFAAVLRQAGVRGIGLGHPRREAPVGVDLQRLRVRGRLRRVVAEREDDAVRVPVEVGVEHRAGGQLALQEHGLARNALPVLEHDESRTRTREAAKVLVDHVEVPRVGEPALHGEQFVELEVGVEEEDAAAESTDFADDAGSVTGQRLAREPLRVKRQFVRVGLQFVCGHGLRHVGERAARQIQRRFTVVNRIRRCDRRNEAKHQSIEFHAESVAQSPRLTQQKTGYSCTPADHEPRTTTSA